MTETVTAEQVRSWIDDDLAEDVEPIPDRAAEFNFAIEISNLLVHVIKREPSGPLLIGQQIEYGPDITSRIRNLAEADRNAAVTRIRETLACSPIVYGFLDENGTNVHFAEMSQIFVEQRVYPDGVSQHAVMTALVDVWKAMRYLDDIVSLLDAVER